VKRPYRPWRCTHWRKMIRTGRLFGFRLHADIFICRFFTKIRRLFLLFMKVTLYRRWMLVDLIWMGPAEDWHGRANGNFSSWDKVWILLADGQAFDRIEQNSMQIVASTKSLWFEPDLRAGNTWMNCTSLHVEFIGASPFRHSSISKGNKCIWNHGDGSTHPFIKGNRQQQNRPT
jgi:hypothetical protein